MPTGRCGLWGDFCGEALPSSFTSLNAPRITFAAGPRGLIGGEPAGAGGAAGARRAGIRAKLYNELVFDVATEWSERDGAVKERDQAVSDLMAMAESRSEHMHSILSLDDQLAREQQTRQEAQQLLNICNNYLVGLAMETKRKELPKSTVEEQVELECFLVDLNS